MRIVKIIIITFMIAACNNSKQVIKNKPVNLNEQASMVLSYAQNPGNTDQIPEYEIKLFSNRQMYLDAKRNLDVEGKYMRTLNEREYNNLVNAFVQANFFHFQDSYTADMTNLPTRYLYFNHNNTEKKILDYCGAPKELKELELLVQSFLDRIGWVKMSW